MRTTFQRLAQAPARSPPRAQLPCTSYRHLAFIRTAPRRTHTGNTNTTNPPNPFSPYGPDLLDAPLRPLQPVPLSPSITKATSEPATPPDPETRLEAARIVFGSRLAGPAERRREIVEKSHEVAGVLVPPKPEEPENCCMSGCVNCVWDRYREEVEEWAAKSAEARQRMVEMRRERAEGNGGGSVDEDGGGREGSWDERKGGGGDLFEGVPVGIREFMKTEKRLKEMKKKRLEGNG